MNKELLKELGLLQGIIKNGQAGHKWPDGYLDIPYNVCAYQALQYLTGASQHPFTKEVGHQSKLLNQKYALAYLCLQGDRMALKDGAGIQMILAERDRQIARGMTTSRDAARYKNDELSRFAIHRLNGDESYYPFADKSFSNAQNIHTEEERFVQAGAILLAHLQCQIAQAQQQAFMESASLEQLNLETNKAIAG
jgi:hypothetical protein